MTEPGPTPPPRGLPTRRDDAIEPFDVKWSDLQPLLPKIAAGLLAGGVLVFNGWFAGIFTGGKALDADSWKFFVLIYLQAVFAGTSMTINTKLFYDVAGGVIAGVLIVGCASLIGAVSSKFDLVQFLVQLGVGGFAAWTSLLFVKAVRPLQERITGSAGR
jgi:hypothetical protein